ncbi:MAG TPA: hypothetical protein P5080_05185 [Candidatus Paceibacterota bacterium]|nr:hypothetical protein [Candidatus Paceibacterota bacterium]HSA37063.1 hypothetical protein [Candidatus Paceibacterota bacterium]
MEKVEFSVDKTKLNSASQVNPLAFPADYQILSSWEIIDASKDNKLEFKIEIVDPANKILKTFENTFSIKQGSSMFRHRAKFQGLPFTVPGKYRFNLYQKKEADKYELVSSIPLDIKF